MPLMTLEQQNNGAMVSMDTHRSAKSCSSEKIPTCTYTEFVKFRKQSNACVAGLCQFLDNRGLPRDKCRIYNLLCGPGATTKAKALVFEAVDLYDLQSILAEPSPAGQGRIIVVEDLHPSVVEILGATLDIDPVFFADHILTKYTAIETSPAPPSTAIAPSQIVSQPERFNIHFQWVVDLGVEEAFKNPPWTFTTAANVPRSVRRLSPLSGRQLGIARSCCSILVKEVAESWIVLILVDPTAPGISCDDFSGYIRQFPLHNGIEDFRAPISFSEFRSSRLSPDAPAATSSLIGVMLDSLAKDPPANKQKKPSVLNLAYYPLEGIIGEWILYSQVMTRCLSHYEYSFKDIQSVLRGEKDDMVELQMWRHRAIQTQFKIQSTRQFVAYQLSQQQETNNRDQASWDLILADLSHLSAKIDIYGQSIERMVPVVRSMFQLLDSRRSIAEAVNVRRLTIVALVFVPLSWVASSLFSMADGFAPGQSQFWVYFVVAIPLCLVIGAFSLLAESRF